MTYNQGPPKGFQLFVCGKTYIAERRKRVIKNCLMHSSNSGFASAAILSTL